MQGAALSLLFASKSFPHCTLVGLDFNTRLFVCNSNGVGRSGTYCAISVIIDRLKTEQVVDVFQVVKAMRIHNPDYVTRLVRSSFYLILMELCLLPVTCCVCGISCVGRLPVLLQCCRRVSGSL